MSGFMSLHFPTVPFLTSNGSPVMLVILETNMLILFPKREPPCYCDGPLFLFSAISKTLYTQHYIYTFLHSSSHLNCTVSTVYLEEFVLSYLTCFELSAFASLVKPSYHCLTSVGRKTLSALPVDTFYKNLIISFLTILLSILYANLSLALISAPWRVAKLLGLCEVPMLFHFLEASG